MLFKLMKYGLESTIRRKRRPLVMPSVPPVVVAVEPVKPVAEPVEITKPKKSRDDAPTI